jgi:hypothetical protein
MKPMDVTLPEPLNAFIQRGNDTFQCDDGDWKIEFKPAAADPSSGIPAEALIIAKNGLGDLLFLKPTGEGSKVFGETVHAFWHEEQLCEVFSEDIRDLARLEPPVPSRRAPIFYADGKTEVRIGDKVSVRSFLVRRSGTVSYVPGVSPKQREMEHHGLSWVGITLDQGGHASTVIITETRSLKASVKRLSS